MRLLNKFILLTVLSIGVLYAYTYQNGILSAGEELIIAPKDGYSFNVKRLSGSGANYDIQMSNKGKIYYSDENQIDDIYLVFHDDVMPGDRIKVHVNSGRFEYSFSSVNRLPTIVKKALIKKAIKEEVEEKYYKQTHHKKRHKSKKIKKEEPIVGEFVSDEEFKKEVEIKREELKKEKQISQSSATSTTINNQKPFSDSFYDKFTAIFKDLVKQFAVENKNKSKERVEKKVQNSKKEAVEDKRVAKSEVKKSSFRADEREIAHEATILRSNFDKLPSEIKLFEEEKKVIVSTPKNLQKEKKLVSIKKALTPLVEPPKQEVPVVKNKTHIKSVANEDKFAGRVIGNSKNIDTIDTSYKEGYEDLNDKQREEKNEQVVEQEPKKEGDKIVITKILEKDKEKSLEDKFAGRVLGKSSDRVLGGGYDPSSEGGSFGVRATKNSLPISAWIEVFKNGTKSRVKTFYTSTRKLKKIKLPAGVYMIRATYRTRDGKLQKTLKNIHIKNGEDITKHVTFNEGRLKVVAKKGGKAQYVKVVVYKSGSKGRYTYEFSDRDTGVAIITLPVGVYDIEVINHDQKREFRSERIKASNTDTIVAEF